MKKKQMAAFVSTSDRASGAVEPLIKGQPGPAYYNPSLPAKKSFHLNTNGRWL